MHRFNQLSSYLLLVSLFTMSPVPAKSQDAGKYLPCSTQCDSETCLQDCFREMAVRGEACEPEVLFHPDSGIFCGRECPADRVTCSKGDSLGRFVWDKSFTEDLERVEYRYDRGSKTFGNFSILRNDGTQEDVLATFVPEENSYLFCGTAGESLCERFDFEPKTGWFRSERRHGGGERDPAQTYRILVIPLRWEGYTPNLTLGELNDFMENQFVPHVEESSCGAVDIEYVVTDWVDQNPDDTSFSQIIDEVDPDEDFGDYNGLFVIYPEEGRPIPAPMPSGCCTSRVFTLSTDDGTYTFGFMDMDDSLSNRMVGRAYSTFVPAQGVLHSAQSLECTTGVENCFEEDPDSGNSCAEEQGDLWEGMGVEIRSQDLLYSAIVREKMGWGYVYDLINPAVAGGNFTLHSLESCDEVAGISVHLDDEHEYVLDYSETVNEDSFVAFYNPLPASATGISYGPINSYRPLSQFNEVSKIAVRKVVEVTNESQLLDMTPDSLGLDFLDALLPVGSSYERCAGTPSESGIFIYPYYTVGRSVKIYIGPGDDGTPPEMFLTTETTTEVTLPPACIPMFDAAPLIPVVANITDDTAVMRADLQRVDWDEDGVFNIVGDLGEGLRFFEANDFIWLVSPFDLDDGENLLRITAQDIFLAGGGGSLIFPVEVERYRPEFVSIAAIPEIVVGDASTMWVAVQLEDNPFLDRVEFYKDPILSDCDPSLCADLFDPEFVAEMWSLGGGYYYWVFDAATDLGPGDFSLFARAYDVCGEMEESDLVTVHVIP